jgi:hypothetical protein
MTQFCHKYTERGWKTVRRARGGDDSTPGAPDQGNGDDSVLRNGALRALMKGPVRQTSAASPVALPLMADFVFVSHLVAWSCPRNAGAAMSTGRETHFTISENVLMSQV